MSGNWIQGEVVQCHKDAEGLCVAAFKPVNAVMWVSPKQKTKALPSIQKGMKKGSSTRLRTAGPKRALR